MTIVKICGITTITAGLAAIDAGADYLGFVFYPPSHRHLDVEVAMRLVDGLRNARPDGWRAVGVFVDEPLAVVEHATRACGLDVVQLQGHEDSTYVRAVPAPVFKAARFQPGDSLPTAADFGALRILVDANVPGMAGGTGVAYDWRLVRAAVADGILAGGLAPTNIVEALTAAQPWGVDVSSGVEVDRHKRPELIIAFVEAVRTFDAQELFHAAESQESVTT
jgi:phosphoribosylanthranilate isomerase